MPRDGTNTRNRILDVAERLVIDNGFSATSVDQVIAESATSKGAFFHHFSTKGDLAAALVDRYVGADLDHLERALAAVADVTDPRDRLLAFLDFFVEEADELMAAQSSCLYVAALTERQLVEARTAAAISRAVRGWREAVSALLREGLAGHSWPAGADADALADHLFVTFEGTFLLCRATGDPAHMRRQLTVFRALVAAVA